MFNRGKAVVFGAVLVLLMGVWAAGGPCPLGDLDGNCKVDATDIGIFADQWLELSGCSGPGCADLDGINRVDMNDWALFANDWLVDARELGVVINEFLAVNDDAFATTYTNSMNDTH